MKSIIDYITKNNISILEEIKGHFCVSGCNSGLEKNRIYKVKNNNTSEEYSLMYCEKDTLTFISNESIDIIKSYKSTFFYCKNGYIATRLTKNHKEGNKQIYLHQLLMNHYGKGKGQMSVDHINRNKLDNRLSNLRIINQSEQNKNQDKRKRKKNTQELPEEIKNISLPKYIYYSSEIMHKGKSNEYKREFFRIEKHPNLDKKSWSSSKSIKISIMAKLVDTIKMKEELDIKNIKL